LVLVVLAAALTLEVKTQVKATTPLFLQLLLLVGVEAAHVVLKTVELVALAVVVLGVEALV
jgi:hypothetical protein